MRISSERIYQIKSDSKNTFLIGVTSSVFSSIVLIVGIFMLYSSIKYINSGIPVIGTVKTVESRFERNSDGESVRTYTAIVGFQDKKGNPRQISLNKNLRENSNISMLYLAENPNDARINSILDLFIEPFMFIVFGGAFLTFGILMTLKYKNHQD